MYKSQAIDVMGNIFAGRKRSLTDGTEITDVDLMTAMGGYYLSSVANIINIPSYFEGKSFFGYLVVTGESSYYAGFTRISQILYIDVGIHGGIYCAVRMQSASGFLPWRELYNPIPSVQALTPNPEYVDTTEYVAANLHIKNGIGTIYLDFQMAKSSVVNTMIFTLPDNVRPLFVNIFNLRNINNDIVKPLILDEGILRSSGSITGEIDMGRYQGSYMFMLDYTV